VPGWENKVYYLAQHAQLALDASSTNTEILPPQKKYQLTAEKYQQLSENDTPMQFSRSFIHYPIDPNAPNYEKCVFEKLLTLRRKIAEKQYSDHPRCLQKILIQLLNRPFGLQYPSRDSLFPLIETKSLSDSFWGEFSIETICDDTDFAIEEFQWSRDWYKRTSLPITSDLTKWMLYDLGILEETSDQE
jgi:hypothetical protein